MLLRPETFAGATSWSWEVPTWSHLTAARHGASKSQGRVRRSWTFVLLSHVLRRSFREALSGESGLPLYSPGRVNEGRCWFSPRRYLVDWMPSVKLSVG